MRTKLSFWLSFVLTSAAGLAAMSHFTPMNSHRIPVESASQLPDPFVAVYQDIGLDYYIFRFGLLGTGKAIREADVICSSSSKGLYGFDPQILSDALSTLDRPVRVFNLSFGFGEGFGYLTEVVKTLDIRDKVLLADLTDNTSHWHYTAMARQALQAHSAFDAYKVLVERWLSLERGKLLEGWLPRIEFHPATGFGIEHPLGRGIAMRSLKDGRMMYAARAEPLHPSAGAYPFPFDPDGQLKKRFLSECASRNIQIVFTSIPYQGYDESWGSRTAAELGYLHLPVSSDGIELIDPTHMATNGRRLFSSRLAKRLKETGEFNLALRKAQKPPQIATRVK